MEIESIIFYTCYEINIVAELKYNTEHTESYKISE